MNYKTWDKYNKVMHPGINWSIYCTKKVWLRDPVSVLNTTLNNNRVFIRGTGLLDSENEEIFEQDYLWCNFNDMRYCMTGPVVITPEGVNLGIGLPSQSLYFTIRGNVFMPMFGGAIE